MNQSLKKLIPDHAMASSFLLKLGAPTANHTFQTFDDAENKDPKKSRVFHGTLEQHFDALTTLNQNGAGVFAMVNLGDGIIHEGCKTCRTNSNVIAVRALFADLDGAPIGPILDSNAPPHILVESSPGKWHVYWLTNDTKLDEFKSRQQIIAHKFGGDKHVCDLARVLRLPGFYHQKAEPFMSRLVSTI